MVEPPRRCNVDGAGPPAAPLLDLPSANADTASGWLITDTPEPRQALSQALQALQAAGLDVEVVHPASALAPPRSAGEPPRWMVVDLMPELDGVQARLAPLQRAFPDVPLLALVPTGCSDLAVQAVQAGAADFCDRSAPAWELPARVRALCRPRPTVGRRVEVGDLVLELDSRSARVGTTLLNLTTRQFELLLLLMQHAGRVLSPDHIEQALNLPPRARGSNVVEVHVHHLRRRIGPGRLSTLRGQGYILHGVPREGK